ncbi:MAG TPA: FGGY family carbohydrate kinase [Rectinemataceae bacterium]
MEKAVAVIDIGMTNKKIALYGTDLKPLELRKRSFIPRMVDGLETHDLEAMEAWFLQTLKELRLSFDIGAIAVCAHGATFVCADSSGKPVLPCVYYTHEPGPEFQKRFYSLCGTPENLQATTGTPDLSALINPAKGLLFAKEIWPEAFAKAELMLPLPQYWGMRLTGRAGLEGTYMGCHTYLYDWEKGAVSSVAQALGIGSKLPMPLRDSWEVLGKLSPRVAHETGLSPSTPVTMGIHDSNASFLPYRIKMGSGGFVVNSTGTWCVLMRPAERYGFEPDELGKVVFFNRSAYNEPVKTAIFLGGREHELWSSLSARPAGASSAATSPAVFSPSPALFASIIAARDEFILPEIVPGSGQFPGSLARAVQASRSYPYSSITAGGPRPPFLDAAPDRAEAVLTLSLVLQTLVALRRTGLKPGEKIFTEGGFRNNPAYNAILAAALPDNPVLLTDMEEATSFGAALTALAALEGASPTELGSLFEIGGKAVEPMAGLDGFGAYAEAWLSLAGGEGA